MMITPSMRRPFTLGALACGAMFTLVACAGQPRPITSASRASIPTSASRGGSGMSDLERGVLDELNRARTNPSRYAETLEGDLKYYNGNLFRRPGDESSLQTREGASAVREAIKVLRSTSPLPALRVSTGMTLGARDHVDDQAPRGLMNHRGTDGSMAWDRVSRYGDWKTKVSENMTFGPSTPRDVIVALLVDDGIKDRGHRRNILDPEVRVAGVVCAPHKTYRVMCDIVHAGGFTESQVASRGKR